MPELTRSVIRFVKKAYKLGIHRLEVSSKDRNLSPKVTAGEVFHPSLEAIQRSSLRPEEAGPSPGRSKESRIKKTGVAIVFLVLVVSLSTVPTSVYAAYSAPPNFRWFSSQVAGSGLPTKDQFRWLRDHGIRAVLCLTAELTDDATFLASLGISYKRIPIVDNTPPTMSQALEAVRWIQRNIFEGRKVLVHCRAGKGRAPTVLASWYVYTGYTAAQAISWVRNHPDTYLVQTQIDSIYSLERYLKYQR